jgi:topoisomerase-4 subunit B
MAEVIYNEDNIRSLDWKEHIRLRPGMYIGKLGDGSTEDDGIYVLIKEVLDNSIDEFVMGHGKQVDIKIEDGGVIIRDYGRGIPLGKVIDCVSKINTGGKYDSKAFKKSVGLNGVGTKAVNALSEHFKVVAFRDGKSKTAEFKFGELVSQSKIIKSKEKNGTLIEFVPDPKIFKKYKFKSEYVEDRLWDYVYLNAGLKINFNKEVFFSKNGLLDLLTNKTDPEQLRYDIIHLKGDYIEIALTHGSQYGEEYYSFVNGQNTTQGGTHLQAFREGIIKTIREHFGKNFDSRDIQGSIIGAISVRVEEPVFESQTKTKLGSIKVAPDGDTVRTFVVDFMKAKFDNFLHKNKEVAQAILKKIQQTERERKEIAGIKKLANQRAKKANIHNKKLRDCKVHYNDKRQRETLQVALSLRHEMYKRKPFSVYEVSHLIVLDRPRKLYMKTKNSTYSNMP